LEKGAEKVCVICGKPIIGWGNNAEPVKTGRCCDLCNNNVVIPRRLFLMRQGEKK
jgi:hypothetical protein